MPRRTKKVNPFFTCTLSKNTFYEWTPTYPSGNPKKYKVLHSICDKGLQVEAAVPRWPDGTAPKQTDLAVWDYYFRVKVGGVWKYDLWEFIEHVEFLFSPKYQRILVGISYDAP